MEIFLPIILIISGLLLIGVEVYLVPGFNVVGIGGLLLMIFGIGLMFDETGVSGGLITLTATVLSTGGLIYLMWKTGAWNHFVLSDTLPSGQKMVAGERDQRARYLGVMGVALTPLRPTGIVEIGQERLEVSTEGEFIAAGSKVRVVAMDRRRYFVRLAKEVSESSVSQSSS